jgi:hypothetical protein
VRKTKLISSGIHGAIHGLAGRIAQAAFLALMAAATLTPSISYAAPLTSDQLSDIEQIQQLKARYFRLIDKKDWTNWGNVFATNATVQASSLCLTVNYSGRSQIVSGVSAPLQGALTVHRGYMPEITLTSTTTATGTWEMEDRLNYLYGVDYHGWGNYSETYVKQNGQWYIQSTVLTRLREEVDGVLTGIYLNGVLTCL